MTDAPCHKINKQRSVHVNAEYAPHAFSFHGVQVAGPGLAIPWNDTRPPVLWLAKNIKLHAMLVDVANECFVLMIVIDCQDSSRQILGECTNSGARQHSASFCTLKLDGQGGGELYEMTPGKVKSTS